MKAKLFICLLMVVFTMSFINATSFAQDETVKCACLGKELLKSEAKGPVNYNGKDYYFCDDGCLKKFKENPKEYLNKVTTVCCSGMKVDKDKAIKVNYKSKDYFFCNEKCKETFNKDPEAYLAKVKTCSSKKCCSKATQCEKTCSDKAVK